MPAVCISACAGVTRDGGTGGVVRAVKVDRRTVAASVNLVVAASIVVSATTTADDVALVPVPVLVLPRFFQAYRRARYPCRRHGSGQDAAGAHGCGNVPPSLPW